jgi:E1A/CREB-binding protein
LQANLSAVNDTQVRLTHEQQADRAAQLQRTMELLVHASGCSNNQCTSANCLKVKTLFQHAVTCERRITGGCALCRCPPPPPSTPWGSVVN